MTPKVGDYIILDGVSRVITRIQPERGRVHFGNPPDMPAPPSLAGACSLAELQPLATPHGVMFYLPGRLEKRKPREGAVQLERADHNINSG